jgi:hypothetical protein
MHNDRGTLAMNHRARIFIKSQVYQEPSREEVAHMSLFTLPLQTTTLAGRVSLIGGHTIKGTIQYPRAVDFLRPNRSAVGMATGKNVVP